ncbi:glycine--tRNA ligase subunit beta [Thioalkalivibrio sp. HK1]|uniref:glycine--tRNA ligase subunit beta n=1 Tax=Thioalkalivibrio sp. HK1 TaxID=1469245 RepID=UPI00046ECF41|nr:glycine--tRNA ligase subunit beta [Thioalkalivibrio sp. HK1]
MKPRTLLVEIGTEELPPKSLRLTSEGFAAGIVAELDAAGFDHGEAIAYATPRRLAVRIPLVPAVLPDRTIEHRGPPFDRAFDEKGNPTPAASGFAKSSGVAIDELIRIDGEKGSWLGYRSLQAGARLDQSILGMVERVLGRLPAARRMRWQEHEFEFLRPIRWIVSMHGPDVIEGTLFSIPCTNETRGHRFLCPQGPVIEDADSYEEILLEKGRVVADFDKRKEMILEQAKSQARDAGGEALIDPDLLEENTALVEWPVAIRCDIGDLPSFRNLPDAVIIASMQGHQRYFPVVEPAAESGGETGPLMPCFIAISNIDSPHPEKVRQGNLRVIRPRLEDAVFFLNNDKGRSLESRLGDLQDVVFHARLGTLHDKSKRLERLAGIIAKRMLGEGAGSDAHDLEMVESAERAGLLAKCDLLTEMVGEFPELQGEMGGEYALNDSALNDNRPAGSPEREAVASAIRESYRPRFAKDSIPATEAGQAVALADKLDTLVGIFAIGQAPKADKDPFALRRAALGVLRILIEGEIDLDLESLLIAAKQGYPEGLSRAPGTSKKTANKTQAKSGIDESRGDGAPGQGSDRIRKSDPDNPLPQLRKFIFDRLRAWFLDQGIPADVFNAVHARFEERSEEPKRPFDFACRVYAVDAFRRRPEAAALAAANKRIRNILRQSERPLHGFETKPKESLFCEPSERALAKALDAIEPLAMERIEKGDYTAALHHLASLRDSVDSFFDDVKVMDEDEALRNNRLALLGRIASLFMETADISSLQSTGA